MEVIRKELAPLLVYAFPTRYNEDTDTVEMSPDGGTSWQPFPDGDPRLNNHILPAETDDPRCDAAARISAGTQVVIQYIIDELDLTAAVWTIVNGFIRLATPLFTVVPYLSLVAATNAGAVNQYAGMTINWPKCFVQIPPGSTFAALPLILYFIVHYIPVDQLDTFSKEELRSFKF